MPLDDLLTFFDPTLDLPIGGKTYTVRAPDHTTGLRITAWQALVANQATAKDRERLRLDDDAEHDFLLDCLGSDVLEQMTTDAVPWPAVRHAAQTAFVWIVQDFCKGTKAAEQHWASVGKAPSTTAQSTSTSTGGASTTRSRRRGSGTTSQPTSSPD